MSAAQDPRLAAIARYDFRDIHPNVLFGTSSDRYAGWIGQIYPEHWAAKTSARYRKLGGKSYKETTVPVAAVSDFFQHFSVVEWDFTFYRPLIEADGEPSTNYHVISRILEHAPDDARFLVKVPQAVTAPFIRGLGSNREYLDPDVFVRRFRTPLEELVGDKLCGLVFEQGYQSVSKARPAESVIEELDVFLDRVGLGTQIHMEIRSPHYLTPLFFDWLETRGVGYVYSHWTWLPSIRSQWKKSQRFTSADSNAVLRLLTPLKMRYADAYALAHPFDQVVPELTNHFGARAMIDDSAALALKAVEQEARLHVIANNRAWGNAPELVAEVTRRILDYEKRKRG